MTAARFARWGSIAIVLAVVLTPTAALAKHHDRWDRDDDDRDDRRRPVVIVQERGYGGYGEFRDIAFNNGYQDGFQKGREDGWNRNAFDPYHHLWYRGASRGYDGYGPHEEYRDIYRNGFLSGYEAGFGAQPVYYGSGPVYVPAPRRGVHADVHVGW